MSKSIGIDKLGPAVSEALTVYHEEVTERVNEKGREAIKRLVKQTKATAPEDKRGSFKKNISSQETDDGRGMKRFTWYVKPPDHRLTHLIVKGHATKNGDRTKPNPFLQNALDEVLPDYENAVKEAIKG